MREVQLIDKETIEVFYDKLTFIYLEMPKFRKSEDELVTHFDEWMYVLKNLHRLHDKPAKLQEKVFDRLFNEAEIAKLTPEDMRTYEGSLKTYRHNYSVLETARKEGKQEGQEGIEKGIEIGASQREIEIARRLKQKGVDMEVIAETTGLSKKQIEQL